MDEKNQIKEIANSVRKILCKEICSQDCSDVTLCDEIMQASKILYNDGIRKLDKASTVISKKPDFTNHTSDPDWTKRRTTMNKENLKPCPFCGGEASLIKRKLKTGFYPSGGTYYIHCKNCLITTQPRRKKESIIEIWNRRVNENG